MDMEVDMVDSFINPTRNNQESLEYNLQSLESNMKVLNDIQKKRKRKREVENWCEEVGKIKNQFLKLQKDLLEKGYIISENNLCVINSRLVQLIEQSQHFRQLFVDVHQVLLDDQDLQRIWACLSIDC
ncbi:unnamed protein product [Withania somnifera]